MTICSYNKISSKGSNERERQIMIEKMKFCDNY